MKRYLLKLSDDETKRNNTLRMLSNLGCENIELCSKSLNVYCVEMDEETYSFIAPFVEAKEEDEGYLCNDIVEQIQ